MKIEDIAEMFNEGPHEASNVIHKIIAKHSKPLELEEKEIKYWDNNWLISEYHDENARLRRENELLKIKAHCMKEEIDWLHEILMKKGVQL